MSNLSLFEQLSYATTRITCCNDEECFHGTGFFFNFTGNNDEKITFLFTNKHVVEDCTKGHFTIHKAFSEGLPKPNEYCKVEIQTFSNAWIFHPDINIDLCATLVSIHLEELESKEGLFYVGFSEKDMPSVDSWTSLDAVEDIYMICYPNGLFDEVNGQPIFRKGITATHPAIDYEGEKKFLIDIAAFEGSSGAPVFLLDKHSFQDKLDGSVTYLSSRLYLLGVLYAGPQMEFEVFFASKKSQRSSTEIPMNLGWVLKSDSITSMKQLLFDSIK